MVGRLVSDAVVGGGIYERPTSSILHALLGEIQLEFISLWSLQATTKQLLVSPDPSEAPVQRPPFRLVGAIPGVGLQLSGQRAGFNVIKAIFLQAHGCRGSLATFCLVPFRRACSRASYRYYWGNKYTYTTSSDEQRPDGSSRSREPV